MNCTDLLTTERQELLDCFRRVRQASIDMCRPLAPEDYRLQPIEEASPPWWNLGHTSWFFVRNVLEPFGGRTEPEDAHYDWVLNSYYVSLGSRLPRARRGSLSRPTTDEIYRYRASVDRRMEELIESIDADRLGDLAWVVNVGIQHEQQHQELFYTEIKCILAQNPRRLRPHYCAGGKGDSPHLPERPEGCFAQMGTVPFSRPATATVGDGHFLAFEGGLFEFGHCDEGWCWDNELPVHKYYLEPFALENRLVTNGEYLEFIDDGGYREPLVWLDNGWAHVRQQRWTAPLYWEQVDGSWWIWTLFGMQPLRDVEPVCHVSFYEADAFARWKSQTCAGYRGARLPSEREWEHAARVSAVDDDPGAFLESGRLHPLPHLGTGDQSKSGPLAQMAGALWQWTGSHYEPYPGYQPLPGALTEYNSKFMDNQRVLRGGSCVTPRDHFRISYRNFWAAATRFQFTGIRLARDTKD